MKKMYCSRILGLIGAAFTLCGGAQTAMALSTNVPPGSNFNLSGFTLQLPTGSEGNVTTESGSALAGGFTNQYYFYTNTSDGSMVMMDPHTGWTTSGSLHPRVEMRENAIWPTTGNNAENATVKVTKVPSNTTIGQIFQGTGPSKPLCELQYNSGGGINLLLENTNAGGNTTEYGITTVPLGTTFNYTLQLDGTTITVVANGVTKTFTMNSSFDGEEFYFKAGDYDQSAVEGTPTTAASTVVQFYALSITHGTGGGGGGNLNGTWQLTPENATGSRLDVAGNGTANGTLLNIYQSNGTTAQSFAFSNVGVVPSGDYNFVKTGGSYCVQDAGTASGSAVEIWACAGTAAQAWNIVADSSPSGYYQLHPSNSTGLCLDVKGAGTANNTPVDVYTCNQTNAQQWSGL